MLFEFNSRNLLTISTILAIGFYYYLVQKSDFLYIQYDAYYYSAVAEGFSQTGEWKNIVTQPPSELRTPQNGVIMLHSLLILVGVSDINTRLHVLAVLNTLLIILLTWCSFILYQQIGLSKPSSWLLSLSISLSFYYYMVLLQPINDAIYIALSYITIILILKYKLNRTITFTLFAIAIILPQFRLTGILIFIAAFLLKLLLQKYKDALKFIALTITSISSPVIINFIVGFEIEKLGQRSESIIQNYNIAYFIEHLYKTFSLSIPEAFFRLSYFTFGFTIANHWFGLILSLIIVYAFIKTTIYAWSNKNQPLLLILIFIGLNIAFFQLHPAQPTRYLLVISPLLVILFYYTKFQSKVHFTQTYTSISIVLVTIILSILGIFKSDKAAEAAQKKVFSNYIKNHTVESNYTLLSYFPRTSYFLLNKSSSKNIQHALKSKSDYLLIIGPRSYQALILKSIQKKNISYKSIQLPIQYVDYQRTTIKTFGFYYRKNTILAQKLLIQ